MKYKIREESDLKKVVEKACVTWEEWSLKLVPKVGQKVAVLG